MLAERPVRRKLTPEEREQRRQERNKAKRVATFVGKMLDGWSVVATYRSSSSSSVHTVERNGEHYRCTCQGFRIFKRGYCKHTELAQEEGL